MDQSMIGVARRTKGFMPDDEGHALYEAARATRPGIPLLEIGSYCGKSTVYLGAAAREIGSTLFTIDHHRGSEEHQPGEEYFDPALMDSHGRVDTLPELRRTLMRAAIEDSVVVIVGDSGSIARHWSTPLGFVLIDGSHSARAAAIDYEGWAPSVARDGFLAIHDVFEDPADGGRPPFEIYTRAVRSGAFEDVTRQGSLRVLRRVSDGF
jgi:predicted O-methyltransferase YrrM